MDLGVELLTRVNSGFTLKVLPGANNLTHLSWHRIFFLHFSAHSNISHSAIKYLADIIILCTNNLERLALPFTSTLVHYLRLRKMAFHWKYKTTVEVTNSDNYINVFQYEIYYNKQVKECSSLGPYSQHFIFFVTYESAQ